VNELIEGAPAPNMNLPRDGGGNVSLAELAGKKVVLYFYPKDDTSGCTTEALDFTALADDFAAAGAVVVGVSPDPVKAHDKFVAKHNLGVILASDEDKTVLEAYGALEGKEHVWPPVYGHRTLHLPHRRQWRIARIWRKVKVKGHAQEVLEAARSL
jgi:peroxiredoxin Q/BCP